MDSQEWFHNEDKFPLFNMERLQIYSDTDRWNITKTVRQIQSKTRKHFWLDSHPLLFRHLTEAHKLGIWDAEITISQFRLPEIGNEIREQS